MELGSMCVMIAAVSGSTWEQKRRCLERKHFNEISSSCKSIAYYCTGGELAHS